jgi:hypothetical protein
VCILSSCLFVIILIIYGSTNVRTQTLTILKPSQTIFEDLYRKYSGTIKCSCKQIAIRYDRFVSLQGGQIKNSKFRNFFFKIRKPSEAFFEKSEINQKKQFFAN